MRLFSPSIAILLGLALASCNESGGGLAGSVGIGEKSEAAGTAPGPKPKDDEAEEADHPVEVSGAFLACAFMDSEAAVLAHVENEATRPVDIGCGLYRAKKPVNVDNLTLKARILTAQGKMYEAKFALVPKGASSQFHVVVKVPPKALSGTIQIDIKNKKQQRAAFRKAMWAITSFDGSVGFNIGEDVQKQKKLAEEQKDASDGKVVHSSWWEKFVAIAVAIIGEEIRETTNSDFGTKTFDCDERTGDCSPWGAVPTKPKAAVDGAPAGSQVFDPGENFTPAEFESEQQLKEYQDKFPPPKKPCGPNRSCGSQTSPSPDPSTPAQGSGAVAPAPSPSPAPSPAPGGLTSGGGSVSGLGSGSTTALPATPPATPPTQPPVTPPASDPVPPAPPPPPPAPQPTP